MPERHSLLVLLFVAVYVNLSKNSFFCAIANFKAKADAKVRTFAIPCKYFSNFFFKILKVFGFLYKNRLLTPYYIL